jgi:hypothetical protein
MTVQDASLLSAYVLRILITEMSCILGTNLRCVGISPQKERTPGPEVTNVLKNSPETKSQNLNKCPHIHQYIYSSECFPGIILN